MISMKDETSVYLGSNKALLFWDAFARNTKHFSFCYLLWQRNTLVLLCANRQHRNVLYKPNPLASIVNFQEEVSDFVWITRLNQKSENYLKVWSTFIHTTHSVFLPYRCCPTSKTKFVMTSFTSPKQREAKLIAPCLSIVRALLVLWFPGHIWRGGIGFHWKPCLCSAGASQI